MVEVTNEAIRRGRFAEPGRVAPDLFVRALRVRRRRYHGAPMDLAGSGHFAVRDLTDPGELEFNLSAWLGGADQRDFTGLSVLFRGQ